MSRSCNRRRFGCVFTDRPYRATRLNRASISLADSAASGERRADNFSSAELLSVSLAGATAATVSLLSGPRPKSCAGRRRSMGLLLYLFHLSGARVAAVVSVLATSSHLELRPAGTSAGARGNRGCVKVSAGHRLLIWSFAGDRIAERPLWGGGWTRRATFRAVRTDQGRQVVDAVASP